MSNIKKYNKLFILSVLLTLAAKGTAYCQTDIPNAPKATNSPLKTSEQGDFANTAYLKIINRNDGKADTIKVRVGEEATYQNYTFKVPSCWQESDRRLRLNSRALLEIFIEDGSKVFSGWLFSEHPSLSSFPNLKFNVLLQRCTDENPSMNSEHSDSQGN